MYLLIYVLFHPYSMAFCYCMIASWNAWFLLFSNHLNFPHPQETLDDPSIPHHFSTIFNFPNPHIFWSLIPNHGLVGKSHIPHHWNHRNGLFDIGINSAMGAPPCQGAEGTSKSDASTSREPREDEGRRMPPPRARGGQGLTIAWTIPYVYVLYIYMHDIYIYMHDSSLWCGDLYI
jgi:hypothetical protein